MGLFQLSRLAMLEKQKYQHGYPMPLLYAEQSLSTQTAYAQLLNTAWGAEHVHSLADLTGSFNEKTVKGRKYWYFQFTEPSGGG